MIPSFLAMLFTVIVLLPGCSSFSDYVVSVQGHGEESSADTSARDELFKTKVTPGMNRQEVRGILGEPVGELSDGGVWFYEFAEGSMQTRYYLSFSGETLRSVEKRIWHAASATQGLWPAE